MKTKEGFLIFLKGFFMGICDIIPGVSGGTIAFITGIYPRLIKAVKNISFSMVIDFFKAFKTLEFKKFLEKWDLIFLIVLGLGIGFAILSGSRIIGYLLQNYFSYTIAFFIGLILASSKIIYSHIDNHKIQNISFGLVGLLIGFFLVFLVPVNLEPSLWYVFIAGFVAISAMFLPGISGAFLLLIMGIYEFMLDVLHHMFFKFSYLIVFLLGAFFGVIAISRLIGYLLEKDKPKTLYALLGLVLGALSIPVKKMYFTTVFSFSQVIFIIIFILVGIIIVALINKLANIKVYEDGT